MQSVMDQIKQGMVGDSMANKVQLAQSKSGQASTLDKSYPADRHGLQKDCPRRLGENHPQQPDGQMCAAWYGHAQTCPAAFSCAGRYRNWSYGEIVHLVMARNGDLKHLSSVIQRSIQDA